jgi:hypothetical protein
MRELNIASSETAEELDEPIDSLSEFFPQLTYEDSDLWSEFFKDIEAFNVLFAIAFASYGSPTSTSNFHIQSTPFIVSGSQSHVTPY